MMRFDPPPEPSGFDENVRQQGNNWLSKNLEPKTRLKDYWSPFIKLSSRWFW